MPNSPTPTDPNCVFCKIVAGKIPSYKVYEDDIIFAFMDIGPIVKGHTLIVPKAHFVSVLDAPADLVAAINQRIPKLAKAVLTAVHAPACHVLTNAGPEASQSVQHLHYHILPRYGGDGYRLPWPAAKLDPAEAGRMTAAIAAALGNSSL